MNRNKEYRLKRKSLRKDYIIQDKNVKINRLYYLNENKKAKIDELKAENKQLKEDLEYVLNQVLGAFENNWCIDWNFSDIRKKYNIEGVKNDEV